MSWPPRQETLTRPLPRFPMTTTLPGHREDYFAFEMLSDSRFAHNVRPAHL
jgi:hypothetical protein